MEHALSRGPKMSGRAYGVHRSGPDRNLADWQSFGLTMAGVLHNSLRLGPTSVLKIYTRRPIWMWLSQRALPSPGELSELTQIFNITNSAGPLSKCDLSIKRRWKTHWLKMKCHILLSRSEHVWNIMGSYFVKKLITPSCPGQDLPRFVEKKKQLWILNLLIPSLQNVVISTTITQETIAIWIKLETKGFLLIERSGLQVQYCGIR